MLSRATALVTLAIAAAACAQTTVSIDPANTYQTIEGFGAHGSAKVWWQDGTYYTERFGNLVIGDMGLTMIRNEFYPDFEPSNENGDPNNLDMSKFSYTGIFGNRQKGYIVSMKNKAASLGEPLRWITSYWTPPKWMKTNNSEINGGHLLPSARAELAELAVATVRAYKEQCGVDLYALSIQNEPAFEEPYNSCVYTAEEYRDAIKVIGPKLHGVYPDVKLFGAEDMLHNWTRTPYAGMCQQDPVSRDHLNVFAVHGYSDGVHPTPASEAVSMWTRAGANCTAAGKPLWMTETSGYTESWDDCLHLAEMIYAALKYGKLAAWVWWQLGGGCDYNALVTTDGEYCRRGYIHKHFARYIRPGAVMIDAISSEELVFSVAFHHPQQHTLALVLLNAGNAQQTVSLAGAGLPSLTVYRSTSSESCQERGTLAPGATLTMPAQSLVTLYGSGYQPTAAVRRASVRAAMRGTGAGAASVYNLRGRKTATDAVAQGRRSAGVVVLHDPASGVAATHIAR
ncbi:MAG: hypothetical protein GF331_17560 [Chitinivibrionales bacterium]|nr:hypothetical protein [Chitinivibrionales bacterium]